MRRYGEHNIEERNDTSTMETHSVVVAQELVAQPGEGSAGADAGCWYPA